MKRAIISALMAAAALGASAWAQTPDPHHPAETAAPPAATRPATPPQAGMGGMDMMRMMQGMHMRMGGPAGMGMIDHIEGRLAFLRAELKITEAQANAWNTFAEALRGNAQKLAAVRPAMMGAETQSLPDRLHAQERWLTARVEGIRTIRTAFAPLFSSFSDEQKKTAGELLGQHLGLSMMSRPMMGMGQMDAH